ncbi:TonB-dependent receptor [Bacteroidia bacterium]|nr:TonB-dependent receptor [Bacteroidia bacterium]
MQLTNMNTFETLKTSFAPISNSATTILILGSLPGDKSLELGEYYGHPSNRFWKVMAHITGSELPLTYADKKQLLLKSNIGVWDVAHQAKRKGSLDSDIKDVVPNDLGSFVANHKHLKVVGFNGKKAETLFDRYFTRKSGINYISLPSTSPANAGISFGGLCEVWRQMAIILLLCVMPCTLPAQSHAHYDLEEVVVAGSRSKLEDKSVANVTKLNLSNSAEISGLSLSQKLAGVAGISNFSTGTGIGKPVIRGLSGNRIAVFAQGTRIENQQWGDEHGLGLDENGYEQVEIIKGPASLLYGSDALGGVLYFSDALYAKGNSLEGTLGSEYNSNTNGWRNTGAFKLSKNRFHWNAFGGYTTHEDYRDGNHDAVPNSRFHTGDFKTSLGYTGEKIISSLKYSVLSEKYGLVAPDEEGAPFQKLTTHIISSENTCFFEDASKLKINLGYVFNNRKEFEDGDIAALDMNLGTFSYDAKWYLPKWNERWTFTLGTQGMYQTNANKGEEMLIPDATTADIGVFGVSEYYYTEKSHWQIGLRFDGRNIDSEEFTENYTAFNFSTGIVQSLRENLSLRANLSSGYRTPNMFELLSDGVHEGTNRYEIGNRALKTENSYQMDVSLDFKNEHVELFLNPYFNYIRHYIFLQPSDEILEEQPVYYYSQADACLYGGEAGFHFHPHPLDWLHVEGSYSNTFGEKTDHEDLPLMPTQKLNATVRANFSPNNSTSKILRKFSAYLQEQYSFAQNSIAEYETATPAYNLVNAGLAFEFQCGKQKIKFNAAVNNIFNTVYYDHLSRYKQEGIYDRGRNLNLKVSVPFGVSYLY